MKKSINLLSLSTTAIFLSFIIFIFSCRKDASMNASTSSGQQTASIYLTDAPGFFDQVLIDIKSVTVMVDTCTNRMGEFEDRGGDGDDHHGGMNEAACDVWDTLNIAPGIYDLLTLRNGTDTLLASGNLPSGKIVAIKIQLGPNNSLVKDSVSYPLNLPASQSIVLIKLNGGEWDEFKPKHCRLWLDFDLGRSIVRVHDNEFFLNPFIRFFTVKTTGSVSGIVMPKDAFPVISVFNGTDTSYALPNGDNGAFKVRGLNAGTYSVFINASNGYADTTITGVNVTMVVCSQQRR